MGAEEAYRVYSLPRSTFWSDMLCALIVAAMGGTIVVMTLTGVAGESKGVFWFLILGGSFMCVLGLAGLIFLPQHKTLSLIITKEGIRNDDPSRPNIIPWNDIKEIKSRRYWQCLDILSFRPLKPIRIGYRMEDFDEAATLIALGSENRPHRISNVLAADPPPQATKWMLYAIGIPIWILLTFALTDMGVGGIVGPVAVCLVIWVVERVFGKKKDPIVWSLEIGDNALKVHTRMEEGLNFSDVDDVSLTLRSHSWLDSFERKLDVAIRLRDGTIHLIAPNGVNALDVFYSVHAAWERYKQQSGTGESESGVESVSTDLP